MNIFYLDADPRNAARMYCDKHIRKMILEYAQMLSTAHHELQSKHAYMLYKPTHANHPSCKWVRHCRENYVWLFRCYNELCKIYKNATGKQHKTDRELTHLLRFPPMLLNFATYQPRCMFEHFTPNISPMPQCMPDSYKYEGDAIRAYQTYYRCAKKDIATFTYNPQPAWYVAQAKRSDVRTAWLTDVPEPVVTRSLQRKHNHTPVRKLLPRVANKTAPLNDYATSGRVAKLKPAINSMNGLLDLFSQPEKS